MNTFTQQKKIVQVFRQYGIKLTGRRKFDDFYNDLQMDQIFVLGLIFELELVTQIPINDEDAYRIKSPAQIIQKLIPNH